MKQNELISALQQIKDLAEKALRAEGRPLKSRALKKSLAESDRSAADSLSDHILQIRDKGFFKEPRTAGEVHLKLQPTYHCESNRVAVALFRLVKRKKLRKAAKSVGNKKQTAYAW